MTPDTPKDDSRTDNLEDQLDSLDQELSESLIIMRETRDRMINVKNIVKGSNKSENERVFLSENSFKVLSIISAYKELDKYNLDAIAGIKKDLLNVRIDLKKYAIEKSGI